MNPIAYLLAWLDSRSRSAKRVVVVLAWVVTAHFGLQASALPVALVSGVTIMQTVLLYLNSAAFIALVAVSLRMTDRWWGDPLSATGRLPSGWGDALRWKTHRRCLGVVLKAAGTLIFVRVVCDVLGGGPIIPDLSPAIR